MCVSASKAHAEPLDTNNYALSEHAAQANSSMPVRVYVSGSHEKTNPLTARISFEPLEQSALVQTKLTLKDSSGKLVAYKSIKQINIKANEVPNYTVKMYGTTDGSKTDDLPPGANLEEDFLYPNSIEAGLYTLEVSIEVSHKHSIDTYKQSYYIYIYDESKKPLPAGYVVSLHMPSLLGVDKTPQMDLIEHYEPLAQNLLDVLSELSIHPNARMTLSIPYVNVQDWMYLANLDPKRPSPLTEAKQALYHELISDIRNNVEHGRLQIAWQGYSNPSLALMNESYNSYLEYLQFHPDKVHDERPKVEFKGSQLYAPTKADASHESLEILERNNVSYVVLDKSQIHALESLPPHMSSVVHVKSAPELKLIIPSETFYYDQHNKTEALLYEESFNFYLQQSSDVFEPLIIKNVLDLDRASADVIIATLKRGNSYGWISWQPLEELADHMTSYEAKATTDASHLPSSEYSSYFKTYKDTNEAFSMYANMVDTRRKNDKPRKLDELTLNMLYSQSKSLVMLDTSTVGYRHTLMSNTQEYLESLLSSIVVSTQKNQIKNATGSVPILVRSDSDEVLHLNLSAHGGPSLQVREQNRYTKVPISTLTGENYISIPIAFTQSNVPEHTLYIDLYAGNMLVKEQSFAIDALRLDIIVVLIAIMLVFFILIMLMRRRLREMHGTIAIHDEAIQEELPSIKAGLLEDLVVVKPDDPEALEFFDAPEESNSSLIDDEHIYYHGHHHDHDKHKRQTDTKES